MVRTVAERAFIPTRHLLEEFGDMMILTGRTIWSALRPPYPYGGELVSQFLFTLRLVWFPLLVTTVAINYGAPGLQAGNFLTLFGAVDRLGGFFVLASIREIGPLITGIVMAGVAGTAITAIVCCYKGMSASGGAEGVGRAVNEAVVVSFLGFGAFNYVFTQTLLATHPNILVIR